MEKTVVRRVAGAADEDGSEDEAIGVLPQQFRLATGGWIRSSCEGRSVRLVLYLLFCGKYRI